MASNKQLLKDLRKIEKDLSSGHKMLSDIYKKADTPAKVRQFQLRIKAQLTTVQKMIARVEKGSN